MYQLTSFGVRRDDGALIPSDPDNTDWQAYEGWLAAGNIPAPVPPEPASYVPPTPLDWFLRLPQETQAALDVAARTDTAVSLALRYASGVVSVDVADPRTIANVNLLFTKGLITVAERDRLLEP